MKEPFITKNTQVHLTIATFFVMLGVIVTGAFTFGAWKEKVAAEQESIRALILSEKEARMLKDSQHDSEIEEYKLKVEAVSTSLIRIDSNIVWVMSTLEEMKDKK